MQCAIQYNSECIRGWFNERKANVRLVSKSFRASGSFLCNEDSLLLLDTHASHTQESIKNELEKMKVKQKFIPAKATSYRQPLDVGINGPFKIALREEWNFWFEHGSKEFTPKRYRKKPSYDYILKMVSSALKKITPDIIKRSFEACWVKPNGQKLEAECLNGRLRGILGYHEGLEEIVEEEEVLPSSDEEYDPDVELDFLNILS